MTKHLPLKHRRLKLSDNRSLGRTVVVLGESGLNLNEPLPPWRAQEQYGMSTRYTIYSECCRSILKTGKTRLQQCGGNL